MPGARSGRPRPRWCTRAGPGSRRGSRPVHAVVDAAAPSGASDQSADARGAMLHDGREQVVALGEDVGRDDHLLADGPLDREPAGIDLGPDPFDHHARGRTLAAMRRLPAPFERHD